MAEILNAAEVAGRQARVKRPRRSARRRIRDAVASVAVIYVAWVIAVYGYQGRLLFLRELAGRPFRSAASEGFEELRVTAPDGSRVIAWFIPGDGRSVAAPGPAVIIAHGNAELIEGEDLLNRARLYRRWGISVLLPEFRGYGDCGGTPSQAAITADMVDFYDQLAARPEVDPSRIILHGRSLGGGIAAALAAERTPAALVLESTFTSVASFAWGYGVPPMICRHPYRTDEVVARLGRPLLILHGRGDDIIPVAHGRRLHELAKGSTYVEMDAAHNDFPRDWNEYGRALGGFLSASGLMPAR